MKKTSQKDCSKEFTALPHRSFLGLYLISKNLVDECDILDALELQQEKTPSVESLFLQEGIISEEEQFKIHTFIQGSDMKFIDAALRCNIIDEEKATKILETQEQRRPYLGDCLTALNRISHDTLKKEIQAYRSEQENFYKKRDALKEFPLFSLLSEDVLLELAYLCTEHSYEKGEILLSEGKMAHSLFAITSGQVQVVSETAGKEPIIIALLREKDIFGEASLFYENELCSASIVAETETKTLEIPRETFIHFLKKYPQESQSILIFIIKTLFVKLSRTNKDLIYEREALSVGEAILPFLGTFFR